MAYNKVSGRWKVNPVFEISCSVQHLNTLKLIKQFFGVGNIYYNGNKIAYRVTKKRDLLDVIIPHFAKYPLISFKHIAYGL